MLVVQFLISFLLHNTPVYGGDLRDLAFYKQDPISLSILEDIVQHPPKYLPPNVYYISGYPDRKHQNNVVFGIELNGNVLNISYLKDKIFYIRQLEMDVEYLDIWSVHDIKLQNLTFTINVGLVQRKLILTDDIYGIQKVFPLGVSSFDLGVSARGIDELMTPRFTGAWLDPKRAVYAERASGYNMLPFMPMTTEKGGQTWYAFHSVQNGWLDSMSKHRWNGEFLYRGFLSHGCIRVRMRDLYTIYYIVTQSKKTTVNIKYYTENSLNSSYPYWNNTYNQVKNYGYKKYPKTKKAPAGYSVTEPVAGTPPIYLLSD